MSDLGDFPTDSIVVIRIPAILDLGIVRQGDHLVVIPGRGVVAVDTRRELPEAVWHAALPAPQPAPEKAYKPKRLDTKRPSEELKRQINAISKARVIEIISKRGTATTMEVADDLHIGRKDGSLRDRVKRIMRLLRDDNAITIHGVSRRNFTRYRLRSQTGSEADNISEVETTAG